VPNELALGVRVPVVDLLAIRQCGTGKVQLHLPWVDAHWDAPLPIGSLLLEDVHSALAAGVDWCGDAPGRSWKWSGGMFDLLLGALK